jgi:opacity protein-like surface antigen
VKRLLALLVVLGAHPAFAQGFEAELRGGYTTPGGITAAALGIEDLEIGGGFTWGASATYLLSPRYGIEASWTRQGGGLEIETRDGSAELFDTQVDQLQGAFVFQLGSDGARVRPFLTAGAGAAFFAADGLDSETKLSFGFGGGVKWAPAKRWGVRLQARYLPTHLDDTDSEFCDPFGFCQGWLHQFEMSGGIVVRF